MLGQRCWQEQRAVNGPSPSRERLGHPRRYVKTASTGPDRYIQYAKTAGTEPGRYIRHGKTAGAGPGRYGRYRRLCR